jgi:hypothetical protein
MAGEVVVTHTKVSPLADWTQTDVDEYIAAGLLPPGTLLADIMLNSDWNANHTLAGMTQLLSSIRDFVVVDMNNDNYTMSVAEATAYLKIITNTGVGKTLTWPTTSDAYTSVDQQISMQGATNPVILASQSGGATATLPAGTIGSSAITYIPGVTVSSKNQVDGVYYRAGHNGVVGNAGATRTLAAADAGKVVRMSNAAASTVTIDPMATVEMGENCLVRVICGGAGGLTIAPGAGVTITGITTAVLNQMVTLMRDGMTDTWYVA